MYGLPCLASFTRHVFKAYHTVVCISASFLLIAEQYVLLYGYTLFCLSIHQLMDSWVVLLWFYEW